MVMHKIRIRENPRDELWHKIRKHMKTHINSNWRSVRAHRQALSNHFIQRHSLRWHAFWIGLLTLLSMSIASLLLRHNFPNGALGIRFAIVVLIGYAAYLLFVRLWAGYMSQRNSSDSSANDIPTPDLPFGSSGSEIGQCAPSFEAGGGGDFGGGGAQASFDGPDATGEVGEKLLSGAAEVVGAADEGAVVIIPVLAIFALLTLAFTGAGLMLSLLFGVEVVLAVTVELAIAVTAGRTIYRVASEHWLNVALHLTWKPMLGVIFCAMTVGFIADYFFPGAQSAMEVIKQLRS
jgi:hypothetical protein